MSKAKIVKSKTWAIADTTHEHCPCAETEIYIPVVLNNQIYEVYRHGKKEGIEISVFAKIEEGAMTDIFIPEQENTAASVGYLELIPMEWNCLIHSHPDNMKTFSIQDKETLFVNRDYCLLICNGEYTDGVARVTTDCGRKIYATINLSEELNLVMDKIKKKTIAVKTYSYKGTTRNTEVVPEVTNVWDWEDANGTKISDMTDSEYTAWERAFFNA